MCSFKLIIFVVLAYAGYASAAAKPISFDEIGRKLNSFGKRALPAVSGLCGFISGYQGIPQGYPIYSQAYPQFPQGYPQFSQQYPQVPPVYPQFPQQYPQNFPQTTQNSAPRTSGKVPLEQEDMNKFDSSFNQVIPPPETQNVLRKLHTF